MRSEAILSFGVNRVGFVGENLELSKNEKIFSEALCCSLPCSKHGLFFSNFMLFVLGVAIFCWLSASSRLKEQLIDGDARRLVFCCVQTARLFVFRGCLKKKSVALDDLSVTLTALSLGHGGRGHWWRTSVCISANGMDNHMQLPSTLLKKNYCPS